MKRHTPDKHPVRHDVVQVVQQAHGVPASPSNLTEVEVAEHLGSILRESPRTSGRPQIGRFGRENTNRRLIEVYKDTLEHFRSQRKGD